MKAKRIRKILVEIAIAFLCGCAISACTKQTNSASQDQRSTSGVAVCIDGKAVSIEDIKSYARVVMTLGMNKQRRTKVGRRDHHVYSHYCKDGIKMAVRRAAIQRYAAEKGLTNSTDTLQECTHQLERQYGVKSKKLKRWHNLDDLKYMLGTNAPILDAEIVARATYLTVSNHIVSTMPVQIPDTKVLKRIKSISDYNTRMAATNALIYARATNVWLKIVGKEMTFEQAATNYSEDVYIADGCEWGTFSRDQLADDPAVVKLLPALKIGDVTPPVESDGGLAVLRLDEIEQDKNFTFSRVFFRLPMFFDEESPEQARDYLRQRAEKDLIKRELSIVEGKMKIRYPNGTNLFEKIFSPQR